MTRVAYFSSYERQCAESARVTAAEAMYTELITQTLTKTVRTAPVQALSLPVVTYGTGVPRIGATPLAEVVADECSSGKPLDALMAVIAGSDCPMVEALRKAIADRYAYANAADIAEVSQ